MWWFLGFRMRKCYQQYVSVNVSNCMTNTQDLWINIRSRSNSSIKYIANIHRSGTKSNTKGNQHARWVHRFCCDPIHKQFIFQFNSKNILLPFKTYTQQLYQGKNMTMRDRSIADWSLRCSNYNLTDNICGAEIHLAHFIDMDNIEYFISL